MRLLPQSPRRLLALLLLLVAAGLAAPVLAIALRGDALLEELTPRFANTATRALIAEAARPYAPAPDPSISPLEAGELFHALRARPGHNHQHGFRFRSDIAPAPRVDASAPYPGDSLFPGLSGGSGWDGPNPLRVFDAVAGPLTADQRRYLDAVLAAPVWSPWDRLAQAPAADLVAGQFVLPFGDSATFHAMPIARFAATKEMAYASVTRSAAHLAAGRRDAAEHALRSVIGVGFVLNDNATTLIDQLIGVVVVNIGRDALLDLWTRTGDPRASTLRARIDSLTAVAEGASPPDIAMRGRDIELAVLSRLRSCATVRGVLTGPSESDDRDFAARRAALARFPGEQALFDLIARYPDSAVTDFSARGESALGADLIRELGDAASFVLRNPRLANCTRYAVMF
jgi:hypothetical protein